MDKAPFVEMLVRAKAKHDIRVIPERWRGKQGVPRKASSEVSIPGYLSIPRVEFFFDDKDLFVGSKMVVSVSEED